MTNWNLIEAGDIIQGKDNKAWEVASRDGDTVTLVRKDAPPFVGKPAGDVVRLLSAKAVEERAIAITQVQLGGRVEAVEKDGIYQVPVEYSEPSALRSHVYVLHGRALAPGEYLPDLLKEHADLHHPDVKASGWRPHHHNPDFLKVIQQ